MGIAEDEEDHANTNVVVVRMKVIVGLGNPGKKYSTTGYIHTIYSLNSELSLFGELQYINHQWIMEQEKIGHALGHSINANWNFLNPRAGFNYHFLDNHSIFGKVGKSQKEPKDDQIIDADEWEFNPQGAYSEKIVDYEIGVHSSFNGLNVLINLYLINLENEVIENIDFEEEGQYTYNQADKTVHRGIEFDIDFILNKSIQLKWNAAISHNYFDGGEFNNKILPKYPTQLSNMTVKYRLENNFSTHSTLKYVGKQFIDNKTIVNHHKENCQSNQIYKGILDGDSNGVYLSNTVVNPDAQKTKGYQLSRGILLSDNCKLNTKPELIIFAEISIIGFLAAALLNYAAGDLQSAMAVRFMSGAAAAPMTSLAFLYMLEPLPPERKMNYGLCAALTLIFMGPALTQVVSPYLLEIGLWHGLTALEAALAMIAFGLIYLLPLGKPQHTMKVHPNDITSYIFIAIGMGSITVALVFGPTYWWTSTPWIGWLLALGIVSSAIAAVIELNRKVPLLDIRWIMSPAVLQFSAVLLLFRIVLSEQTSGAAGLFRSLGLMNEQMQVLNLIIIGMTIAGGVICAVTLKPGRERPFHIVALILLVIGALMDSNSTSQTVPSDMFVSQALIALASALFLPPALLSGMMSALERGYDYILSFVIVFLTTQKVGGILGGALFSTFITFRKRLHLERIDEQLSMTDPLVQERLAKYGGAFGSSTTDAGASAAQGVAVLQGQAQTEASVMAYNDAFLTIAVISAVALAALLAHMAIDGLRAHSAAPSEHAPAPRQPQAT